MKSFSRDLRGAHWFGCGNKEEEMSGKMTIVLKIKIMFTSR